MRYPKSKLIAYNADNKFFSFISNEQIKNDYGINIKCETIADTQEHLILGPIHPVIANTLHVFDLQNNYLGKDEPWSAILSLTAFEVHSTYLSILQAMLVQLVLWCGMKLNTPVNSNKKLLKYINKIS